MEISALDQSYCYEVFFIHGPSIADERPSFLTKLAYSIFSVDLEIILGDFNGYSYSWEK